MEGLNEVLLGKAAAAKVLRTSRLRTDTTVVPANVSYLTDAGLLATAARRIAATGRRVQAAGGARRTRVRDRSRAAGRRAHEIASKLRTRTAAGRDEAQAAVRRGTGALVKLAHAAVTNATRLVINAGRALRRTHAKAAQLRARGEHDPAAGRRRGRLAPFGWSSSSSLLLDPVDVDGPPLGLAQLQGPSPPPYEPARDRRGRYRPGRDGPGCWFLGLLAEAMAQFGVRPGAVAGLSSPLWLMNRQRSTHAPWVSRAPPFSVEASCGTNANTA